MDEENRSVLEITDGNNYGHLILRGGKQPNYDEQSILNAHALLKKAGLPEQIIVDVNHANSGKNHDKQKEIALGVATVKQSGSSYVTGIIVESDLAHGAHKSFPQKDQRTYGLSVTDACIGIEATEELFSELASLFL
jgi:3-deoxy-7-phosphoheptulonate synthase